MKIRLKSSLENTKEVVMKKGKMTILKEPSEQKQASVEFSYLNYLAVPYATILGYLQLPPQEEEVEDETQKIGKDGVVRRTRSW